MTDFNSLGAFAEFVQNVLIRGMPNVLHKSLDDIGQMIEDHTKELLGEHQPGWPPLRAETIERKMTGDSPLLETGELRDSIHYIVYTHPVTGEGHVYVGSDNDKALWHEMGTINIPPRPFLSIAVQQTAPLAAEHIGIDVHSFLSTGEIDRPANDIAKVLLVSSYVRKSGTVVSRYIRRWPGR